MARNYDKIWQRIVEAIKEDDLKVAKLLWDEVSDDAWKYEDLSD